MKVCVKDVFLSLNLTLYCICIYTFFSLPVELSRKFTSIFSIYFWIFQDPIFCIFFWNFSDSSNIIFWKKIPIEGSVRFVVNHFCLFVHFTEPGHDVSVREEQKDPSLGHVKKDLLESAEDLPVYGCVQLRVVQSSQGAGFCKILRRIRPRSIKFKKN